MSLDEAYPAGALPDLEEAHLLDAVVSPVAQVLAHADSYARLILSTTDGQLEASVVIDTGTSTDELSKALPDTEMVHDGAALWCLIRSGVASATPPS